MRIGKCRRCEQQFDAPNMGRVPYNCAPCREIIKQENIEAIEHRARLKRSIKDKKNVTKDKVDYLEIMLRMHGSHIEQHRKDS